MGKWGFARLLDFLLSLVRAYWGTRQVRQGDTQSGADQQRSAQAAEDEKDALEAAALAAEIRNLSDDELRARADRWSKS